MKKQILTSALLLLISLSVYAQQDRKADIIAANQKFMDAYGKGATTMGDFYTTDAQLFPPNSDVVKGNQAIGAVWKSVYGSGVKKAKLETVDAEQQGDVVIETGRYTLYGQNDAQLDAGKYIVIWKKENGAWKLHRDIFNTNQPPVVAAK